MSCWARLGIEPTTDKKAIKLAYARLLKVTRPDDDPEGFKTLYKAYQDALQRAEWLQEEELYEDDDDTLYDDLPESFPVLASSDVQDVSLASSAEEVIMTTPLGATTLDMPEESSAVLSLKPTAPDPWMEVVLPPVVSAPVESDVETTRAVNSSSASLVPTVPAGAAPHLVSAPLLEDEWEHLKQLIAQLINSPLAVNEVNHWEFLKRSPLIVDLEWRTEVSNHVFALVAEANEISLQKKHLYIKSHVLIYLNNLLGWERHWKDLSYRHSESELNAVFNHLLPNQGNDFIPSNHTASEVYARSLSQPWRTLYQTTYFMRSIIALLINSYVFFILFSLSIAMGGALAGVVVSLVLMSGFARKRPWRKWFLLGDLFMNIKRT